MATPKAMYQDKIGLEKLSDGDEGERFWIIFIDGQKLAENRGYFRSTSDVMSEAQVREFFEKGGQPAGDVEAMFSLARAAYRAA